MQTPVSKRLLGVCLVVLVAVTSSTALTTNYNAELLKEHVAAPDTRFDPRRAMIGFRLEF
jgi:hypothetical protein